MNFADLLSNLACPACVGDLRWASEENCDYSGWLSCLTCLSRTPVMNGIVFFTKTEMDVGDPPGLQRWHAELIATDEEWSEYQEERQRRQTVDPYAAFAPFNEAHRAAIPLLALVSEDEAGVVVDLNNRTGWTGEYLAGAFPNRPVIAVWEGNSSVLGYRGFLRLQNASTRPRNLLPIFCAPASRPPIRPGTAGLVHAHDALHRHDQPRFLIDCLALTRPDGTFLAPHVHLSNNNPEPYFERGGILRHGRTYRDWLRGHLDNDPREVRVFAEVELFENASELLTTDGAETTHYNGLVAVAPKKHFDRINVNNPGHIQPDWRCLPNPLLRVNPLTGQCTINADALGSRAEDLLDRHPVYRRRLMVIDRLRLDASDLRLLTLLAHAITIAEAASTLDQTVTDTIERCQRLAKHELLFPAAVASSAVSLQQFHTTNHSIIDQNITHCWAEWVNDAPDRKYGDLMGQSLTRTEVDNLFRIFHGFVHKLNHEAPVRGSTPSARSPILAVLFLALLAGGAEFTQTSERANLRLHPLPDGDIEIERDHAGNLFLSEVLTAFADENSPPRNTVTDSNWWQPVIDKFALDPSTT